MKLKLDNQRIVEYSLYIACVLSNVSQLTYFVRNELTQIVAIPGWIILLIALVLSGKIHIEKRIIRILLLAGIYILWCCILTVFTRNSYFSSSLMYSFFISLVILILGNAASRTLNELSIYKFSIYYVLTTLLVAGVVFFEYFGIGYRFTSRLYAYSSKNSLSQIIFSAVIFMILYIKPQKNVYKGLKVLGLVFSFYILLLLRSRATILSLFICIIIIAFSSTTNKRLKFAILIIGALIAIGLLVSDSFSNLVFNNILFAGRDSSSINALSSGRIEILKSFPLRIKGHWIEGIGSLYYESFPLSAILQFGLFGGLLLIYISLKPLVSSILNRKVSREWNLLLILSIGFVVDGAFEGLTPFGPGMKCYCLWLLYGILLGIKKVKSEKRELINVEER